HVLDSTHYSCSLFSSYLSSFFFYNDPAPTEIYTLSLHDALPICEDWCTSCGICAKVCPPQCIWIVRGSDPNTGRPVPQPTAFFRSEEHTSELQSLTNLVCRLLLEKKKSSESTPPAISDCRDSYTH